MNNYNTITYNFCYYIYQLCYLSFKKVIVSAVFKPEELRQALMPTLEALYRQDPESLPFRQPVDPMLLGIPVSIFNYTCLYHSDMTKAQKQYSLAHIDHKAFFVLNRTTLI